MKEGGGVLLTFKCELHDFGRFALSRLKFPFAHCILRGVDEYRISTEHPGRLDATVWPNDRFHPYNSANMHLFRQFGVNRLDTGRDFSFGTRGYCRVLSVRRMRPEH